MDNEYNEQLKAYENNLILRENFISNIFIYQPLFTVILHPIRLINSLREKDRIAKVRSAFDAFKKGNHDGDLDKLTSFTRSHPIIASKDKKLLKVRNTFNI